MRYLRIIWDLTNLGMIHMKLFKLPVRIIPALLVIATSLFPFYNTYSQVVVKVMASQPEKLESVIEDEILTNFGGMQVSVNDHLSVNGGTPPFNYSWVKGGLVVSTNAVFEVESGPLTNYNLVITDSRGCKTISPFAVGFDDYNNEPVKIYPIPAKSFITIDPGSNTGKMIVALINTRGDKLWEGEISEKYNLPLNYPSGIYFIKMMLGKKTSVKKVMIMGNGY